jgi:hypothetical protein
MARLLDHWMDVPEGNTYRIQEVHLAVLHQICLLVEEALSRGGAP